ENACSGELIGRTAVRGQSLMAAPKAFHTIYSHGFVRASVAVPVIRVADPQTNTDRTLALAKRASELHAAVTLFPELGISAYSNDDLFQQDALLDAVKECLSKIVAESRNLNQVLVVGAPLRFE